MGEVHYLTLQLKAMIFMILPAWMLALFPTLLGGILKAGLSQGTINQMNRYNSPQQQLMRLNAAGLPFAAFAAGQAGQQSSLPDTSGFGGESFMQNYSQAKQLDLLKQQIRKLGADADISENLRDVSDQETMVALEDSGYGRTNAGMNKEADYRIKSAALAVAKNQKQISDIELRIKRATEGVEKQKAYKALDLMLLQLGIGGQAMENERVRQAARNKIVATMEKNGLTLMEAILLQVMSGLSAQASSPFGKIGF